MKEGVFMRQVRILNKVIRSMVRYLRVLCSFYRRFLVWTLKYSSLQNSVHCTVYKTILYFVLCTVSECMSSQYNTVRILISICTLSICNLLMFYFYGVCGLRVPLLQLKELTGPCEVRVLAEWRDYLNFLQNEKYCMPHLHASQLYYILSKVATF